MKGQAMLGMPTSSIKLLMSSITTEPVEFTISSLVEMFEIFSLNNEEPLR